MWATKKKPPTITKNKLMCTILFIIVVDVALLQKQSFESTFTVIDLSPGVRIGSGRFNHLNTSKNVKHKV